MNYRIVMSDELEHHGILGQKWGVRRYQNADGSLTDAGKKRYYTTDPYGRDMLTKDGYMENESRRIKADRYKGATAFNVQRVDSSFSKNKKKYLDAQRKNNEHFLAEREKWFKQEGEYKGKDYYQFKEISADKWFKSEDAKTEKKAWNAMRESVEKAAKEHPLYNNSFSQLKEVRIGSLNDSYFEEINYGKYVVDGVMDDIRLEAIKQQKH